jgi:hypothetical protein
MSKVTIHSGLDDIKEMEDFKTAAAQLLSDIVSKINGQLEFDKNLLSQTVEVTFTQSNVEQAVNHSLNKLIYNYLPISKLAACDIYDGGTDPTKNAIYLKSTVATTVTLVLF